MITVVVLAFICVAFVAMAFLIFTSRPADSDAVSGTSPAEARNVNVNLGSVDLKTGEKLVVMKVERDDEGYRSSDQCLLQDIIDDTPIPKTAADREFWTKVAMFDDLPPEEKAGIIRRMNTFGFHRKDEDDYVKDASSPADVPEPAPERPVEDTVDVPEPESPENGGATGEDLPDEILSDASDAAAVLTIVNKNEDNGGGDAPEEDAGDAGPGTEAEGEDDELRDGDYAEG